MRAPPRRARGARASAGRRTRRRARAGAARRRAASSSVLRHGHARTLLENARAAGRAHGAVEPGEYCADRLALAAEDVLAAELGARHVDEVDALRHKQQVLLAGAVPAQGVEMALDVADRAEVDRAFDAQDLELRAFEQAVL